LIIGTLNTSSREFLTDVGLTPSRFRSKNLKVWYSQLPCLRSALKRDSVKISWQVLVMTLGKTNRISSTFQWLYW